MTLSQSPVRLGVIGAGWFASRRHCPDIIDHPEAELQALCRRDPEQLQRMADHFGVDACFTDYQELVRSGQVHGVVVCSPHHLHYEHTLSALENGLHVLLEKPITLDPQQGRHLVQLAAEKNLALIVAQNPPYWSHCRYLRDLYREGKLGELEGAHIQWVGNAQGVMGRDALPDSLPGVVPPTLFRGDPALNGGGYLIDGGSHFICELLWCTSLRVTQVTAQMDNAEWDIRSTLALKLSNGAFATISSVSDSAIRDKRQHSLYYGAAGTVSMRGFPFEVHFESQGGGAEDLHESQLPEPPTPVGNLVDCMLGRGATEIDGETAVHVVEIINAAYEAGRSGRCVRI